MQFLTADTHFNHEKIIALCKRPFKDVKEMNEELIRRWNVAVNQVDEVYVLGDFAFWRKDAQSLEEIFYSLNGSKHLIIGNHDEQNTKVMRLPWVTTSHLKTVRYGETRTILCHFPLESWWHKERGTIHAHGHCHGKLGREITRRFDVGVDLWDFTPVPITTLIEKSAKQKEDGLEVEMAFFEENKTSLLLRNKGEWALIKGRALLGTFNDSSEAFQYGVSRLGNSPMLIKQILLRDPVQFV